MAQSAMMEKRNPSYLIFILCLSVLALIALAVDALVDLDQSTKQILDYADNLVCVVFFIDFCVVLFRSERKLKYFVTWGWIDLLSSVPVLDALRWGRLARITRIFRVLRGIKAAQLISALVLKKRGESITLAVVFVSIILLTVSAISILHFEAKAEGTTIKSAEDAFWWAIVTITTVGYGDKYPVTTEGRTIAAFLMIAGVGLFGTLSGFIASWFLGPSKKKEQSELEGLRKDIAQMRTMMENMNSARRKEGP